MTKAEFHQLLNKPRQDCSGVELHLRALWDGNDAKGIFAITGLDLSYLLTSPVTSGIRIRKPEPIYIINQTDNPL